MLSILIPIYNYNIFPLVEELQKQAQLLKLEFEIIAIDDCSTEFISENEKITQFSNCSYIKNDTNKGRTYSRTLLTNKSKFNNLLFLDADVFPENSNFLEKYIEHIPNFDVVFGGYKYRRKSPEINKTLRYYYGISREENSAINRNLKPFSNVLSGNMFIKKEIFLQCNFNKNYNLYGMDNYFSYQLFINKFSIINIDNYIYHEGIEDNEVFFEKSLKSVENRKKYLSELKQIGKINSLLKHYLQLKKLKLTGFVSFVFKLFKNPMKKAILSKKPNLLVFDLYRLGYICSCK